MILSYLKPWNGSHVLQDMSKLRMAPEPFSGPLTSVLPIVLLSQPLVLCTPRPCMLQAIHTAQPLLIGPFVPLSAQHMALIPEGSRSPPHHSHPTGSALSQVDHISLLYIPCTFLIPC